MAKILKLTNKDGAFFPKTIAPAINSGETGNEWNLKELVDELLTILGGSVNASLVLGDLATTLEDDGSLDSFIAKVNAFLGDTDATNTAINRWKEIESFLSGITDTQNLAKLLADNLQSAKDYSDNYTVSTTGSGNVVDKVEKSGRNIVATKGFTAASKSEFDTLSGKVNELSGALSGQAVTMPTAATEAGLVLVSAGANRTAKTDIAIGDLVTVDDTADAVNDGLMTSNDYVKLQAIEEGANKYVLPVAGAAIGGVKSGGNITVDASGNVTVNQATKATQDGNGKNIASTYATKDEVATGVSDVVKGASNIGAGTGKLILSNGAGKVAESDYSEADVFMKEDIKEVSFAYGSVSGKTGSTYTPNGTDDVTVTIPSDTSHLTNNGGYAKTSDISNTYVKKTDVKNLTVSYGDASAKTGSVTFDPDATAQSITIPTDTSHLANGAGYIQAVAVSDVTDYPDLDI